MPKSYEHPKFPFTPPIELIARELGHASVAIVGAGPVGLALGLDLARRGVSTTILDDDDTTSHGSRLICMSKRTLEIFDRLGAGRRFREKGVVWNRGRLFFQEGQVYEFDLQPEPGHDWPAFVNIQQYYVEDFLIQAGEALPRLDIRWKNKVVGVEPLGSGVDLVIETPDGEYSLRADYVVACDGARSTVRDILELDFVGRAFQDRFLITDVIMDADFPPERWFWFEPPFHDGQSALLHKQPDDVWRIDLQLDADADPEEEVKEENVRPRIARMLGPNRDFEIEWISLYTFRCRRLEHFRHDRVFFAGDSAHQVSPFGARGGNGGVQDADNLGWKLAAVLKGYAPDRLLDSYDAERLPAADENIRNSTRSTDFMTPKSGAVRDFRDAVLALAKNHDFARRMVNSGRLSVPAVYETSFLNTPDRDDFDAVVRPGAAAVDAPVRRVGGEAGWLLREIGPAFTLMVVGRPAPDLRLQEDDIPIKYLAVGPGGDFDDVEGLLWRRYDLSEGAAYLFRPDQHVAARTRKPDAAWLADAIDRALGRSFGA